MVAQALRQALPSLTLTVERMRNWLHWHGLEEGFRGRKPIDERIMGKKKEKPN